MEVVLVSDDANLQKVCRQVLGDTLGSGWGFTVVSEPTSLAADLYIWDLERSMDILHSLNPLDWQKHIILLPRNQLASIQESQLPVVSIVLKPFTEATLRSFLEQACARFITRESAIDREQIRNLCADRDELLQYVMQANLKLQQYDQDRTNFLARAIHDFRAPLTAISGYCGLLLGGHLGDLSCEQRQVLERMQYSAKRLTNMANAMFQLSIRQRVTQHPLLEQNDIHETVEQALYEMRPFLEEKGIVCSVQLTPPLEPLFFEKAQMEQVLVNLIDNACKFTPRQGSLQIRGYPYFWDRRRSTTSVGVMERRHRQVHLANSYRIDVCDSGPGISPSQLPYIFEEYTSYRGSNDRSGGGLGLAICRMIVTQHQGHIWAETSSQGAVFSFVLPFHRKPVVAEKWEQSLAMSAH